MGIKARIYSRDVNQNESSEILSRELAERGKAAMVDLYNQLN